jgi:hypothetical protein
MKAALSACHDAGGATVIGDCHLPLQRRDAQFITPRRDIQPITARRQDRHGSEGGVDFKGLVRPERSDADLQRTRIELQVNFLVVDSAKRKTGLGTKAEHGGAQMQFRSSLPVRPNTIATGQRAVGHVAGPRVAAGGLHRYRALCEINASDPAGGVEFRVRNRCSGGQHRAEAQGR